MHSRLSRTHVYVQRKKAATNSHETIAKIISAAARSAAAPNPNAFGKITTFVHIGYLAGVFVDIIFSLNLTNVAVDCFVALVTLISLFLYGLNCFKLTAKLHRE